LYQRHGPAPAPVPKEGERRDVGDVADYSRVDTIAMEELGRPQQ